MTEPGMGDRVSEPRQSGLDDGSGHRQGRAEPGAGVGFSRTDPAVPESVAMLRATVADLGAKIGLAPATVKRVQLAVSEAATNVVVHAYDDGSEPGPIHFEVALAAEELRVSVADTGRGLRPGRESPGLGLGLGIIARLTDSFELLQGENGGLCVLMRFAIPPGAGRS